MGPHQVGSLARFLPGSSVSHRLPVQAEVACLFGDLHLIKVSHLRMARLNTPELPFHLVAVLQPSGDNAFLQSGERLLDADREPTPNRLLFLPTLWGLAQGVGVLTTRHPY